MDKQEHNITELLSGLRAKEVDLSAGEIDGVKARIDQALKKRVVMMWYRRAAIAASFLLVIGTAFFLTARRKVVSTGYAMNREVVLPDGSTVLLHAHSTLQYKSYWFSWKAREVWLDGEAYFAVTKKPAGYHPKFVVHTGGLDVKVMGTHFNVYNRRQHIEVMLEEGKVIAAATGWGTGAGVCNLLPGQMVQLDIQEKQLKRIDPASLNTTKGGRLVFNNTPLYKVAQVIADTYGYQISWKDKTLQQERFTGSCPVNDLSVLIAALRSVYTAQKVVQKNRTVIFQ